MIKTFNRMALQSFLPVFGMALLFFLMVFQLMDLFANLWRYLNNQVTLLSIFKVALLFIPKCLSYSLPASLLFSISFTLGNLYANNELIAVFGSGVSILRFTIPFIIVGIILSFGSYFFEEYIVIDTFKMKNELTKELLNQTTTYNRSNPTVISGNTIYNAQYYNDNSEMLTDLIVIVFDSEGTMVKRINAEYATWNEDRWELRKCRIFSWNEDSGFLEEQKVEVYSEQSINEYPSTFRKIVRDVEEMKTPEAQLWIESLKRTGLPYIGPQTEYYKRFAFALTPLIVVLISSAIGGRFKKNILLMSLLTSLSISVVYYVLQMITVIMAKNGQITPVSGAWSGTLLFLFAGAGLYKVAKT